MASTIGILIFDGAEELDFVGPWEVFTASNEIRDHLKDATPKDRVLTISQHGGTVTCAKGMRVIADHSFADCPPIDVLLIPGGQGTRREVENPAMLEWIAKTAVNCTWATSVCTGSLLLTEAGPAAGRRVTTHWGFADQLAERGKATVLKNVRYVRDGNVVTAAGVSAGIDMALWLTGQMHGVAHARATQRLMEYNPAPPYTADT
ncbi:MAG: DJ-1/PfpI family protein [Alphaproteobacteria bacterium]|jgi:transcriptional regulator GlxA family with amidase domain